MANEIHKPARLHWLDYARGIAIILVVYRHAFEGLKNTAALQAYGNNDWWATYLEGANILFFSFRMPLFFIVAGLFIGSSVAKRGLAALVENKVRTILYPYFLWGCMQISVQLGMGAFTNGQSSVGDYLYLLYAPREIAQFWYLFALFNVTVLYVLLKVKAQLSTLHQLLAGLLFFAASTYCAQQKIELGFVTDILHYYLFMAIGEAIAASVLGGSLHRFFHRPQSLLLLLAPFLFLQVYFLRTNWLHLSISPKALYVEQYQPFQYLLIALVGCAFIACLSAQLERRGWAKWLLYTGRHSLYIYVLHVMAFAAVRIFCTHVLHLYSMPLLLLACVAGGVVIPILAYKVCDKLGLHFLFTLEKKKQSAVHAAVPTSLKVTA